LYMIYGKLFRGAILLGGRSGGCCSFLCSLGPRVLFTSAGLRNQPLHCRKSVGRCEMSGSSRSADVSIPANIRRRDSGRSALRYFVSANHPPREPAPDRDL
jgi:hypothetical protein